MKRRLTKLVVFLLLGAVISVAVAVGSFLFIDGSTSYGQPLRHESWILDHGGYIPSKDTWGPVSEEFEPAFGVDRRYYQDNSSPFAFYVQAGWPARCLDGGWCEDIEENLIYIDAYPLKLTDRGPVVWSSSFLPIGVKWFGLCINTLFWAGLLWALLFGPACLRRVVRRWKCHCIKCGYDLRGTSGGGCPECGWGREGSDEPGK